jgi:hypothetical protein
MTDRPAFRKLGKLAEKWRDHAEKRRDYFAELYRSGRWKLYYDDETLVARIREVAEICDRWTMILEQHRRLLTEPDEAVIDRDAA